MQITNNKKEYRFEIALPDGEFAILTYRWLKGSMVLMHTVVPVAHRKKGIGALLAAHVLEYARTHQLKVIVYCAFVAKYLTTHPEYNDLLDPAHIR